MEMPSEQMLLQQKEQLHSMYILYSFIPGILHHHSVCSSYKNIAAIIGRDFINTFFISFILNVECFIHASHPVTI